MARLQTEPPAWASSYIGIPFEDRGRTREGIDCWGLVKLVYAERLGVMLPDLPYRHSAESAVIGKLARDLTRGEWKPTNDPKVGDVQLFRIGRHAGHVGLVVGQARMLHAIEGTLSCIERMDLGASRGVWEPRLLGTYRFDGPVTLTGQTVPLAGPRIDFQMPAGATVAQMLQAAGIEPTPFLTVFVGDVEVPHKAWDRVRPRAGRHVRVACMPRGGGQGGGKSTLRIVASIAVIAAAVAAPYAFAGTLVAAGTLGGGLLAAGVGLAGQLLVNALIPPPRNLLSENAGSSISASISGARNEIRKYGTVPVVMGEHRIAPPLGAKPYTEIIGDDQYLRMLFLPGYGPLEFEDFKIGETSLDEYEGVEIEVRQGRPDDPPMTLFPGTVIEDGESIELLQINSWTTRTSATEAEELSIDISFPAGLARVENDGSRRNFTVALEVEWSPAGANAWTPINGASPDFTRGLDFMFREPEATREGTGNHQATVLWGGSFGPPRPAYLPESGFSWEVSGYVYAPTAGVYKFGLDCSDAGDVAVDDTIVASWYGTHATAGAGTPDFAAHSGEIQLSRGWHRLRVRVESRSGTPAVALGWQPPSGVWEVVPQSRLSSRPIGPIGQGNQRLTYRWFTVVGYQGSLSVTASRTDQIRRSLAWAVPPGQYDVRVRRVTPDTTDTNIIDGAFWTALRTIRSEDPIRIKGVAKIALRIKASEQLQGVLDDFNCLARSILPDWDKDLGQWVERATSNPASCTLAVLRGQANRRPIPESRIDLTEFQAWHEDTQRLGLQCNAYIDFKGTVYERANDVASTGRARLGQRENKYSPIRDRVQTTPVQHFTPRNSHSFRFRKAFADLPHALRIEFMNAAKGYQRDERIVYADGYSEDNATVFESMQFFGVTDSEQIWKHGRYQIAVGKLRPEIYELGTDIENLVCSCGDLVLVTHDVPMWGLGYGRIKALVTDANNNLVGLSIDEKLAMDAGDQYVVRVRLQDGSSWLRPLTTIEGASSYLQLQNPVSANDPWPDVGDLFMFGRSGTETRELIVKGIEIDKDLGATLTLIDHAPAVHLADQGPIPEYDSGISQPTVWSDRPDTPIIESIRSDDRVMIRDADGSLRARMLITLRRPSGNRAIPNSAQVRIRPVPADGTEPEGPWTHLPLVPIDDNQISVTEVEEGVTYEIRLRTVTATGLASAWAEAEHTVIGKVLPPPRVESFDVVRLSDGTRRFSWVLGVIPPDVAGVEIRYFPKDQSEGIRFEDFQPLHSGVLEGASPWETNAPPAGSWTFGIKMVDTSGNRSLSAVFIDRELGPARQEGVAVSVDCKLEGWPGTKTDCHVSNDRTLIARGRETWDTLAFPYGVAAWDNWSRWVMDPATPITYEHVTVDAGFVFDFEPGVYLLADGTAAVDFDYSVDNITWAGWAPLASFASRTVRARFVRFRVRVVINAANPIPRIRELVLQLRAQQVVEEVQDLQTSALIPQLRLSPGDVRVPVSPGAFAVIRTVALSFNGMGAGWTWELVDRDVSPGPRVRLFNPSGQAADATIDAVVRGL